MKKVGIVSCYFKNNYGSLLQAYATQKVLDNMKIDNETFKIERNIDFKKGKKKYYKSQIFNISFIKSKFGMIGLKVYKKLNRKLGKNIAKRDIKFKEFKKEFKLTKDFFTYQELNEASKNYSSIIVGSDQLWLPVNVVADYYTLNWVQEEVNKISYATSFGISEIPNQYRELYVKFLNKINYISVREEKGCKIVNDLTNKEAELVCDPTILLTKEEWMELQTKEPIIKEKYIFCYFLGNNIEHRKFVERLKEKTGYKIVSLNHCDEYVKYSDKFADETPYDVGPKEFLNLIRNAEYVCTDSFHGTVFSLINNVKFYTFERFSCKNGKISTNSRIYSLLGLMDLENRILKGNEKIEEVIQYEIDFNTVNEKMEQFRKSSKDFLERALKKSTEIQKENEKIKYIQIDDKSKCCGCTACKSICPKDAIEMKEDEEGFLYPVVNRAKCINCGLCRKICPILNKNEEKKCKQKAYVVNNKNEQIRRESTSGGAFTVIAEYVIEKGGVVFGATLDKDFNVEHAYVERKEELQKFRGSKYVQSDLKNTLTQVKEFLNQGRWVCFSGTPCQIEGLKNFLGKEYENLVTVDIVCRAIPSPLVYRKYLKYQQEKLQGNIDKIIFRDKRKYGYKYSTLTIENKKKLYQRGVETDPYLRSFFTNIADRPSCYQCQFKKKYRISDITIWDCFVVEDFSKELDDDKGSTRVLIHTEKGKKIYEDIKNKFNAIEVSSEKLTKGVTEMFESVKENPIRKEFFENINKMNEKEFFEKYFPDNINVKVERNMKIFLTKTGAYKKIKKLVRKIRNK